MKARGKKKSAGGRPRKFAEPSGPITITLPERTLRQLQAVDQDRAVAIVKATDAVVGDGEKAGEQVKLVQVEPGTSVIVVGPSASLRRIPFLKLVEIAPTRYLLAIPTGTPTETLEIAIMDQIDGLGDEETYERSLLNELRNQIRALRHAKRMSKHEIILVSS
jgi:hypothetical protein